jgi:glucose/arabinose dehydrogenase
MTNRFCRPLVHFILVGAAVGTGATALAAQAPAPGIPAVALTEPSYVQDTAELHPLRVTVVAKGMNHPFALALLPGGDALVSERGGALRLLRNAVGAGGKPATLEAAPVAGIPAITTPFRNAGLHDLALHPRFAQNQLVFFTFNLAGDTLPPATAGGPPRQQARLAVFRGRFDGRALTDVKQLWVGKSAGTSGSRLTFGTDGFLYITIGAAFGTEAQELDNTIGKVLRLNEDGSVPADNPFVKQAGARGETWSYGHRDPLGLTVHPTGVLMNVEHGPNGGDELNVIRPGRNYGWPRITFGRGYDGAELAPSPVGTDVEPPLVVWLPSIAPTGLMVYTGDRFPAWKNNVFIGSARRGEIPGTGGLERLVLNDQLQELRRETLLTPLHLRIRDVRQGPDGLIYVVTDENDGALLRLSPDAGG